MKLFLRRTFLMLVIGTMLTECTPSFISYSNPNYAIHEYKRVIVFGMFKQLNMRMAFEDAVVDALMEMGYPAARGMSLVPPSLKLDSEEQMIQMIKKQDFDLVIMSSILDQHQELQYHENYSPAYVRNYAPYQYYGMYNYYNYRYGYDMYYGGYGSGWTQSGYYTEQTEYLIESQLYDLGKEHQETSNFIYRGQGEVAGSTNAKTLAIRYAKMLIKDLQKNQILKSKAQ